MASEIVLVNVSGEDSPGMMAMLTTTLEPYGVRVLDVGQAIIHDELALGLLVQVPDAAATAAAIKALLFEAHRRGVTVRFTPISERQYNDWVLQHGKPRLIVTLLAAGFTAGQLGAVSELITAHGLNIEGIRRLSGRTPLERLDGTERTSIEMTVRGTVADPLALRRALMDAASHLTFDFSVQEDTVYRRNKRLVVFDMDSTLINAEVIDELAKLHGVGEQVAAITERAMRGELDFQQSFRERSALLEGLPEQAMAEVAATVALNPGADRLVRVLKHFGYRTAIVSGGFLYVGRKLAERLGIDDVFANELVIEQGRFTGAVAGDVIDAERKAHILRSLCDRDGIALQQAVAIGDGANDLPMLGAAGLGVAYHAKPVVKASAGHAISNFGLDSVLYLIGFSDKDLEQAGL